jgi:hypothetical protein
VAVPGKTEANQVPMPYFPTYLRSVVALHPPTANGKMTSDKPAPEGAGELIYHVYHTILQANTGLEKLLASAGFGRGTDLRQRLPPHCLMTVKFIVRQERIFRENWEIFVSVLDDADSTSVGGTVPQKAVAEAEPAPAPLPEIPAGEPEDTLVIQDTVRCFINPIFLYFC